VPVGPRAQPNACGTLGASAVSRFLAHNVSPASLWKMNRHKANTI
jgi:hypothetical protein